GTALPAAAPATGSPPGSAIGRPGPMAVPTRIAVQPTWPARADLAIQIGGEWASDGSDGVPYWYGTCTVTNRGEVASGPFSTCITVTQYVSGGGPIQENVETYEVPMNIPAHGQATVDFSIP